MKKAHYYYYLRVRVMRFILIWKLINTLFLKNIMFIENIIFPLRALKQIY